VGVLARIFEGAGLATVGLSLVRRQAENTKAPRFLNVEFPLGRPLGRPGDAEFQLDVIRRAFALLARTDVPVLEDHPVVLDDQADEPLACTVPPRLDPDLHPAVDEARGLRPAYDRQLAASGGRTLLGRVAGPDHVDEVILMLVRIADGAGLDDAGVDAQTLIAASQDIRAYYEEAGLALADHVPAARQVESWFYDRTETGELVKAAARALRDAGVDRSTWYYLLPGGRA
jgi:hypothetical protein